MANLTTPSVLPPPLRVDLAQRSLESLAARQAALDLAAVVIYDFDTVAASALPVLAEQFNVLGDAGWDLADTQAKQRALLKEAIALHRLKGTPRAIKRALALLSYSGQIKEWWQRAPAGQPYTFELAIDVVGTQTYVDDNILARIVRLVNFWKNARSIFALKTKATLATDLTAGAMLAPTQYLRVEGYAL